MIDELKLAEVLGALSLATDLANGNPLETALRVCHLSVGLARAAGAGAVECAEVYYASLLRFMGCTAFASEEAALGLDDIAARRLYAPVDLGSLTEVLSTTLSQLERGSGVA